MIRVSSWKIILLAGLFLLSRAMAVTSTDILQKSGVRGGLIVNLGCGDGRLTAQLLANDSFVVHGLDTDSNNVRIARDYIKSLGIYGKVSADTFDGKSLPYIDNLVNLIVSENLGEVSMDEVLRVLCPLGVAYVSRSASGEIGWQKIIKPWPDNIDEWTHYLHDATNNAVANDTVVGPPRRMQWLSGPLWSRHHDMLASISAIVTAHGRIFYIVDETSVANINLPGKWSIVARDAFSGVTLWRKPMTFWAWQNIRFRAGPPQVTRLLVVSGDRLYAPLGLNEPVSAIDAATGDMLKTYDDTTGAEEIILAGDILLVLKGLPVAEHADKHPAFKGIFQLPNNKTIVAVQAGTGRTLWQWSDPQMNPMPETLGSDGSKVYFQTGQGVICLDLNSGQTLWTAGDLSKTQLYNKVTYGKYTLVVADGVVLCNLSGKLKALSAENGQVLWECQAGGGFHSPLDIFVIDGLVWQGLHNSDSISPAPTRDFNEGRDLHTGKIKRTNTIMVDLQTAGHHHRCYREKATQRYIIMGKRGIEMMDLEGDNHCRNNWVRGTCQYGIIPANGLVYAPPHACGCYPEAILHGFWALAPERQKTEDRRQKTEEKLEMGPAYPSSIVRRPSSDESRGTSDSSRRSEPERDEGRFDWPLYRHDCLRSGVTAMELPSHLEPLWETKVGDKLSAPVIADAIVLVCSIDAHCVYALDAQSGDIKWTFTAGGRVDSPPSIYKGKALFGSSDGWVYCLRLSDGQLVWRFQAAPMNIRTVCREQVESLWPVHGSVLIKDNTLYCTAGRSSYLDGGIRLLGLDIDTGKIKHNYILRSEHPGPSENTSNLEPENISQNTADYKSFTAPDKSDSFSMEGNISDILVSDGESIYLRHMRFNSNLERVNQRSCHLFSTSQLLDDNEAHRSHWFYGLGDFSRLPVAYEWLTRNDNKHGQFNVPFGRLLVYDSEGVWGVRRSQDYRTYELFYHEMETNENTGSTASKDFSTMPAGKKNTDLWKWSVNLPIHPRAMLKTSNHLVIAGYALTNQSSGALVSAKASAVAGQNEQGLLVVAPASAGASLPPCKRGSTDGAIQAEHTLKAAPVWDGMAAANDRLYLSLENGTVLCLGQK